MKPDYLISDEILFDAKPDAVPYNYRISYKMAQICLILAMCCGRGGCSLLKLQMISVGLGTKNDREQLTDFANDKVLSYTVVRFDPAVNRAIKFSIAEDLIRQQQNGLFRLSNKGKEFVKQIMKDTELMGDEKRFLFLLSDKLKEEKIKALTSLWRYSNVEN